MHTYVHLFVFYIYVNIVELESTGQDIAIAVTRVSLLVACKRKRASTKYKIFKNQNKPNQANTVTTTNQDNTRLD